MENYWGCDERENEIRVRMDELDSPQPHRPSSTVIEEIRRFREFPKTNKDSFTYWTEQQSVKIMQSTFEGETKFDAQNLSFSEGRWLPETTR